MPRASRYLVEGYTYHLTHRCHDRRFLLKFAEERETYRTWLRIASKRYHVPIYGYCITSNHVHVIVYAANRHDVGRLMQLPSSLVAKQLNTRKNHQGSVWEHPYQCTMIEDGRHLINCLSYVDLNMVRCGVVNHPNEWRWCGYDEFNGTRHRYRIIDTERLIRILNLTNLTELSRLHNKGIRRQIECKNTDRIPLWTESLAVGSKSFVARAQEQYQRRRLFDVETSRQRNTWILKETAAAYTTDFRQKSAL